MQLYLPHTRGGAPRMAMVAASALVAMFAVEGVGLLRGLDSVTAFTLGAAPLSWVVVPAGVYAAVVLTRNVSPNALLMAAVPALQYVALVIIGVPAATLTGFVAATIAEELAFRVAIPAVLAWLLSRWLPRAAAPVALAVSAVWFAVLPGHVAQVAHPAGLLLFVGFAVAMSLLVHRFSALGAAVAVHVTLNLGVFGLEVGVWDRGVQAATAGAGAGVALLLALHAAASSGQLRRLRRGRAYAG